MMSMLGKTGKPLLKNLTNFIVVWATVLFGLSIPPFIGIEQAYARLVYATMDGKDIVVYILPVVATQYLMGVLVQLRHTTFLRTALLPVMPWLAWRAVSALDFSCGNHEDAQANSAFVSYVLIVFVRATAWAMVQEPNVRDNVPKSEPTGVPMAFWNAWDLLINLRGISWNWSRGIHVARPSFEVSSRARFLVHAIMRALFYILARDVFMETIRSFSSNFNSWRGGSIFDHSLPVVSRYLRALEISYLSIWLTYFGIQIAYYSLAIVCTIVFFQHPRQWPPFFDKPWLSTSLSEFWGRRWHQMFRFAFVSWGGVPLKHLFGRPGGVMGTFLASGIFHIIEYRAIGRGGNSVIQLGFFVLNAVGVLLERAWFKKVGRPVTGVYGRIWTFSWLALCGIPVVDQWARAGRFASLSGGFEFTMTLLALMLPPDVDKGFVLQSLCFGTSLSFLVYSLFTLY